MTLLFVDSTAIRAVGHDGQTLYIQFHSGDKVYPFPGVPYLVFLELVTADSPGEYYAQHIRGRYR